MVDVYDIEITPGQWIRASGKNGHDAAKNLAKERFGIELTQAQLRNVRFTRLT